MFKFWRYPEEKSNWIALNDKILEQEVFYISKHINRENWNCKYTVCM